MRAQTASPSFAELRRLFKETAARQKETDAQIRETAKELRRLEGLFGDQWGKLMEALVQPNALKLFRDRGIQVQYVFPRAKRQLDGRQMEVDLLLENGQETVVVEVKNIVHVEDVTDFLADLKEFPTFFPRHAGSCVYGAVAGLSFVGSSDKYAHRRGLFVLGVVGEGIVQIRNPAGFRPQDFGPRKPR